MTPREERLRRRLAALWFADLVGFTDLAGQDEDAALDAVRAFQGAAREVADEHGGRVVKLLGDGALAEFPSAQGAVESALALGEAFRRAMPAGVPLLGIRVAVHTGEVAIAADGDLYGDDVNVAARLQAVAEPGQVVVSDAVVRQLRRRPGFRLVSLGARQLKGVTDPLEVYSVRLVVAEVGPDWPDPSAEPAGAGTVLPSVPLSPRVELRTLGPVGLRDPEGREVDEVLHQPKRLLFLVHLAAGPPGQLHRRDTLLGLFWPELPEDRARNALNKTVHFLRRALDPDVIVRRGAQELGVDPEVLGCDAVAFERALERGRPQDAVALWRGPFLEGLNVAGGEELEHWLARRREHYAARYTEALQALAERAIREGDHARAIGWWRQLCGHDPYHEGAVLGLMEALELRGERGAALQLAEDHARRMREELGAEPDPAIVACAERLRQAPRAVARPEPRTAPRALPAPPTPLVGRERELARVGALLSSARLLTLTGPGGVGKTRLAIQAARDAQDAFPDGVHFVGLGSLRDAGLVDAVIERTCGVVRASSGAEDALADALRGLRCLLILDSFEGVLPAADRVAGILEATEGVTVLVTSRVVLNLRGEHVFPVPPLDVPPRSAADSVEDVQRHGAVDLFVQRARAAKPDFELTPENLAAVTEICRGLDGLPLAIELAAARVHLMGPAMIQARLARRLELLTGGPRDLPERQQTIRGTLDWSYDLLGESDRRLFRHLSVFAGGASLDGIGQVCYPERPDESRLLNDLAALLDNSLIRRAESPDDEPRFAMLETIREYGLDRLAEEGEAPEVRRRHADCYLALAERAESGMAGRDQAAWLDRVEAEHENVREVLDRALEEGQVETAVRLATAIWWFWWVRGHFTEMRWRADQALALRSLLPPPLQANLLVASGALASIAGERERALELLQEALAVAREGVGRRDVVRTLRSLALALAREGEDERATGLMEEALALSRAAGAPAETAAALRGLAKMRVQQLDWTGAEGLYGEALEVGRADGDRQAEAWALAGLGEVARYRGDLARASDLLAEGLRLCRELESKPGIAYLLQAAGHVARNQGDASLARQRYREALQLLHEMGNRRRIGICLLGIAALDVGEGNFRRAGLIYGAIQPLRESLGIRIAPADQGEFERAVAEARSRLDEGEIERVLAEGRTLELDQAVRLALE